MQIESMFRVKLGKRLRLKDFDPDSKGAPIQLFRKSRYANHACKGEPTFRNAEVDDRESLDFRVGPKPALSTATILEAARPCHALLCPIRERLPPYRTPISSCDTGCINGGHEGIGTRDEPRRSVEL
jgi:hypothetical protein